MDASVRVEYQLVFTSYLLRGEYKLVFTSYCQIILQHCRRILNKYIDLLLNMHILFLIWPKI